jgi:large subunit ribosomal protein L30
MPKRLFITLVRSTIGSRKEHKATVRALGLTRRMQTVSHPDTPSIRGMIRTVQHLLHVTEIEQPERRRTRPSRPATGEAAPASTQ